MDTIVRLCQVFINDKVLVILCVTGITVACLLFKVSNPETIVTSAFTGLFGIAVGTGLRRAGDLQNGGTK
jgi:hypothetical protein